MPASSLAQDGAILNKPLDACWGGQGQAIIWVRDTDLDRRFSFVLVSLPPVHPILCKAAINQSPVFMHKALG